MADLLVGWHAVGGIELVEDVAVDIEGHRGRVTCLARYVGDVAALLDEQRDEAVPEVVGAKRLARANLDAYNEAHP